MELTKEKKHEAYKQCLIDIESTNNIFCCNSFIERGYISVNNKAKEIFTELYKLRMIKDSDLWFENSRQRIEALKICIEQTK